VLRFKSLGSGSTGNATVVEATSGTTQVRLLVDCGLGIRVLAQRLAQAGLSIEQLDAIFITHEHADHVGSGLKLALRHGIAIWMSEGTWRACGEPALGPLLHLTAHGEQIDLGAMQVQPFAVPHDAREPLQLRCQDGQTQLGILTDLGHVPEEVLRQLHGCRTLLLECNHDSLMLSESAYPAFLKRRVGGDVGHLSNEQAAGVAAALRHRLTTVLAAHLSQANNRPELAQSALRHALGDGANIAVAHAVTGSPWMRA
jgi:phosphoribosyl 1,2-cyclic phosphodiesterase